MIYAEEYDYETLYGGQLIPKGRFEPYARRASHYLDAVTMGAIETVDEAMVMACCALSEVFYEAEEQRNVLHENNDGYSVTYTAQPLGARLGRVVEQYLGGTGLLYAGIGGGCA